MANITGRTVIFIDLGAAAVPVIRIATNATFTQNLETIQKSGVSNVKVVLNNAPGGWYPYPNQTMATINLVGSERTWTFELQDVDDGTHATWRTGDQAAVTAFTNDCTTAGF